MNRHPLRVSRRFGSFEGSVELAYRIALSVSVCGLRCIHCPCRRNVSVYQNVLLYQMAVHTAALPPNLLRALASVATTPHQNCYSHSPSDNRPIAGILRRRAPEIATSLRVSEDVVWSNHHQQASQARARLQSILVSLNQLLLIHSFC